jgi:pimeloyl-ACP methyl ester carboxylesterase
MHLGMRCSAGAAALRDQQIRREAGMSIFGNTVNFPFPDVCDPFPAIDLGEHYREPLISSVPVLFVSGTLDSHTPPYQAEEVRWGMPHAAHLIVENAGHEDLEPNEEVQAVIGDYLAGKDVSARRVALPPPRFRSVEEAKKERRR